MPLVEATDEALEGWVAFHQNDEDDDNDDDDENSDDNDNDDKVRPSVEF